MELNRIYLDSDFQNTVVPVGQRFLFLGYYDGIEGSEIVIRYKDSDGNFGNIASGSINEEPKEQYIEVNSLLNGFIVINNGSIPVFIKTSLGNFYPVEKDTLFQNDEEFYIDATPYLAYDNVTEFSGSWRVYLSGGIKGDSLRYDEVGQFSDRSKYDDKPYKFSFLATDQSFIYIKLSNDSGDWSDPISLKGERGTSGTTFIPSISTDGNISWNNDGNLENPKTVNIRGPEGKRGEPFKIDVIGTFEERSNYDSQPKDFSFLATDDGKVYIKQSDTSGDWSDPIPFKGDKGDIGYLFTPSVSSDGDLSWSNNGGLENPDTVNIKGDKGDSGAVFTPSVSESGDLSWSNNGGLENPETVNIKGGKGDKGDIGYLFTPEVSDSGDLSWSNNGGLDNPATVNIRGPKGEPGNIENNYIDVTDATDGFLIVRDQTIPVLIEINNAVYPALGMVKDGENYKVPIAPILASANLASYSGTWRVWTAGGVIPRRGVDYWTADDITAIQEYCEEQIVNNAW